MTLESLLFGSHHHPYIGVVQVGGQPARPVVCGQGLLWTWSSALVETVLVEIATRVRRRDLDIEKRRGKAFPGTPQNVRG